MHSDVGNLNQTVYQGYDTNVCPIIGEIRMYLLTNQTAVASTNKTFSEHATYLRTLFKQKGLNLPQQNLESLTLEDFKSVI